MVSSWSHPNTFAVIKAGDGIMSNLNSLSFYFSESSGVGHNLKNPIMTNS